VAILVYLSLGAAAVGLLLLAIFLDDALLGTLVVLTLVAAVGGWWLVTIRGRHPSS
jgi:hypothetical protein